MAKNSEMIIIGLLALCVVIGAVTAYGAFKDEPVVVTPQPIVKTVEVPVNNPETEKALETANTELESLKLKYEDEEREEFVCGMVVDWAEELDLADKYDDELALALNVSEEDLEDYDFTLDLDKCKYAKFNDDDGDISVELSGEIEWENDDAYGEIKMLLTGMVETDDELEDEEIKFVV